MKRLKRCSSLYQDVVIEIENQMTELHHLSKKDFSLKSIEEEKESIVEEEKPKDYDVEHEIIDQQATSMPLYNGCLTTTFVFLGLSLIGAIDFNNMVMSNFFLFGVFGMFVAGIFEYLKGRAYVTTIIVINATFVLTHFIYIFCDVNEYLIKVDKKTNTAYYFSWMLLGLEKIAIGFKGNLFLMLSHIAFTLACFFCTIGYAIESDGVNKVGGVLFIIKGIIGFYLFAAYSINFGHKKELFPVFPFDRENGFDKFDRL